MENIPSDPDWLPYRVYARSTEFPFVDLFARDAAHAMELATGIDGGRFEPDTHCSDWEIDRAELIKPNSQFNPINRPEID